MSLIKNLRFPRRVNILPFGIEFIRKCDNTSGRNEEEPDGEYEIKSEVFHTQKQKY